MPMIRVQDQSQNVLEGAWAYPPISRLSCDFSNHRNENMELHNGWIYDFLIMQQTLRSLYSGLTIAVGTS